MHNHFLYPIGQVPLAMPTVNLFPGPVVEVIMTVPSDCIMQYSLQLSVNTYTGLSRELLLVLCLKW